MRKGWDERERQDRLRMQRVNDEVARMERDKEPMGSVQRSLKPSARDHGCRHGEAFMLMRYTCLGEATWDRGSMTRSRSCGHTEVFWNSRDGVTPFMVGCPSCGGDLQHLHWAADVYAPDHAPHHGQGVWRDGTPDEAEAIVRARLEQYREQGDADRLTPDYVAELIARVRDPDHEGNTEFRRGWPMLHRHSIVPGIPA